MNIGQAAREAKAASVSCAGIQGKTKNLALAAIAFNLRKRSADIFSANERDLAKARADSIAAPLEKRLKFDLRKLEEVLAGIDSLIGMEDPVGRILERRELAEGLRLERVSCPIGVIGMVFESRPDALVQIASLCLKSGNAVLLKGGREARETNAMLAMVINEAAVKAGMPSGWIHNMESREDVDEMLGLNGLVDLIIPRGSNEFVRSVMSRTSIPVMGHADGICHVYVHADAEIDMAVRICLDSKTQYVAVCNAAETFLIHERAAQAVLPPLALALRERGVEIRGCPRVKSLIDCVEAREEDWRTEYLDYIVSIKIVDSEEEAVAHVNANGSHHTDAIVAGSEEAAELFMSMVDSASVFWNASTRFADGFKYGLGAEVGISTSKLHARGPVGMGGLLIYKWKLYGSGDIVADFAEGRRSFRHRELG